jgi:hypothetical protein
MGAGNATVFASGPLFSPRRGGSAAHFGVLGILGSLCRIIVGDEPGRGPDFTARSFHHWTPYSDRKCHLLAMDLRDSTPRVLSALKPTVT